MTSVVILWAFSSVGLLAWKWEECGSRWGSRPARIARNKQIIRTHLPQGRSGSDYIGLVPVTGLEPVRHRWRWILSPLRLPFHHTGNCIFKFPLQNRSSENGGQNRRAIQKTLHIHFQKVLVFQGESHTPEDLANQILGPPRPPIPTHQHMYRLV